MSPYRNLFLKKVTSINFKHYVKRTAVVIISLFALFLLLNVLFPLPDKIEYSTIVTDDRGEVIHAFLTKDEQWRMKTTLEEISPLLRKTIIHKEDRHFYRHPGINPFAIMRALFRNVTSGRRTSGASTITMQVARAMDPGRRTYLNKIKESFRALQLEWKYDKDEILQLYLNLLPYGGNIQGVKSASILYFGKNPDHLSLAEITALSIIPNRPSSLVIGKANDEIIIGRNRWLQKFAAEKVFSEKEIADALQEPLNAVRGRVPRMIPHLANKLRGQGNDIIQTNININNQLKIEKLVADHVRSLKLKGINNAAVVVIDNSTHKVVSYIGSGDFYDTADAGQVNGAQAVRQPGSTLKPLVYALCFDEGLLTPGTVMTDVAVNYAGYSPENYDRNFNGYVTTSFALENSLNIPAVKALSMLGKDRFINELTTCNFAQVRKDRIKLGLSMVLGGCGTTLEELTALYSVFANNGRYFQPSIMREPETTNAAKIEGRRILSPAATFMTNDILSKINRPDFPLNWQSTEHLPKIAWKTGTSYGRRDGWSIGYNKRFTVGVWTGNFSGIGVPDLSGAAIATPLLFKIFNTIDYDSDTEWFSQPADCELRAVCSETGRVPADHCTSIVTDYFIPLISSNLPCDNVQEIMVTEDEKHSFCKTCAPENGYKKKMYKVVNADMQSYLSDRNIAFQQIPSHNPDCEKIFREGLPVITFPVNGAEYLISKKNPEPLQLTCRTGNDVQQVYWYVNNRFYKSSAAKAKQFFVPEEGPVKISCTDDKGRNRDVWITVRMVEM